MLTKDEITRYITKNYEDKKVKNVTITAAIRNVISLQNTYKDKLFGAKYTECMEDLLESDALSFETRKSRIVNFLRLVRSMTDSQFKEHFIRTLSRGGVIAYLGNKISALNERMKDGVKTLAKEDYIDEKYVPWTFIYNRAKEFSEKDFDTGDKKLILRCKILARIMILDHAPRRNLDYTALQFPRDGETQDEVRERAIEQNLNIWHTDKLFINDYKTKGHYGEYVMDIKPQTQDMLQELWEDDFEISGGGRGRGRHNYDRIFEKLKIPDALRYILNIDATVNTLRHSFLTYYYSHKHGKPIYLHEKNSIALSMGNAVNTHDRYVIRNTPFKDDPMKYYEDVVSARNKNISLQDKKLIRKLADSTEVVAEVKGKTAPRRMAPIVREVLEKYKHLFIGKSMEEKRKEKPYLTLSQSEDVYKGRKVKDILGDDVNLIRKWASNIK